MPLFGAGRKLDRREALEARMGPLGVVVDPPSLIRSAAFSLADRRSLASLSRSLQLPGRCLASARQRGAEHDAAAAEEALVEMLGELTLVVVALLLEATRALHSGCHSFCLQVGDGTIEGEGGGEGKAVLLV